MYCVRLAAYVKTSTLMNIEMDSTVADLVAFVEGLLEPVDASELVRHLEDKLESAISTLELCRQSVE